MTNQPFYLIKKKFASISAAATASGATQGAIVFDKAHKVIAVNGDVYGGNIQDAVLNNSILTITKADGTEVVLNFQDVASAQGTMAVFAQLRDVIGVDNTMSVQGAMTNTNFLQGVQSVTQGLVTLDQTVQGLKNDVIHNEQVTEEAIEAIQGAVGLDSDLGWTAPANANFVQGSDSVKEAIEQLDTALQGVVADGKTYTMVQGATTQGYLKTYQLQEVVGETVTNVGVTIDIPKDFLVKSATTGTVTAADKAAGGKFENDPNFNEGDVYLDFVINTKDGSGTDEHLYININSMVDSYTGDTSVIVDYTDPSFTDREGRADVNIDQTNNRISVTVANGAITTSKLADGAVQTAKIGNQAVTTDKIANQGVTNDKMAQGAIKNWNLDDEVVQIGVQKVVVNGDGTQGTQNNDGTTTIATVGGKEIKVRAEMYWNEWSDDEPE